MSVSIESLLHRRTDLSTFLVHLTREYDGQPARDNLVNILRNDWIEARTPLGMGRLFRTDHQAFQTSQKVCCFTETPLEHVWMMCQDIQGRDISFGPYGVAVTKVWARQQGVNPVWYLDITPGHNWLTNPVNGLLQMASDAEGAGGTPLDQSDIARLAPFIEQMGPTTFARKEFWWEREWRKVGALYLPWVQIVAVFVPEDDHEQFAQDVLAGLQPFHDLPPLLDVGWGLERMVSALRGINPLYAGPLPL